MNKFIGIGHLTKDGEIKHLNTGGALYKNTLAVNHSYKKQDGSKETETLFLDFTCFGRGGEIMNEYTKKGSKVLLEGRLKLDSWQDQQGNKKQKISLLVENIEFMDSKKDSENLNNYNYSQYQSPPPATPPAQKPQVKASVDLDSALNDSLIKCFSAKNKTNSSAILVFRGSSELYEEAKEKWQDIYPQVVSKLGLQNLKLNIKKEITDSQDEIPF